MKRRDLVTPLAAAFSLTLPVAGRLLVCIGAALNFSVGLVYAKSETVFCEYKYVMGDNDTKHDAKKIAFIEAKRICVEKVGTLLESETIVTSSQLTKDQVRAYALGLLKTDIVSEEISPSGENLSIVVKVKAEYDSVAMAAKLQELLSNREKFREYKKSQEYVAGLENQVISLQRELSRAKTEGEISQLRQERREVFQQYKAIESKIESLTTSATEQIKVGMTQDEVVHLLGNPRSDAGCWPWNGLNYGKIWVVVENRIVVGYVRIEDWSGCGQYYEPRLKRF